MDGGKLDYWLKRAGRIVLIFRYARVNHFPLLQKDHEHASKLASALLEMGIKLTKQCETNMVWVDTKNIGTADYVATELAKHGILSFGGKSFELRIVLHHQVDEQGVET